MTSNSNYIMLRLIERINSICIVKKMFWDFNCRMYPKLTARPLVPPLTTEIILAVKSFRDSSLVAKEFIQSAKKYVRDEKNISN